MQGYVVDKQGQPVQFRVFDPQSGTTQQGVMLVRGSGITIVSATPAQLQPSAEQFQPVPSPVPLPGLTPAQAQALGIAPPVAGGPAMPPNERGIVVADQAAPQPTPVAAPVAVATPEPAPAPAPAQPATAADAPAPADGNTEGRPEALQQGAAAEL